MERGLGALPLWTPLWSSLSLWTPLWPPLSLSPSRDMFSKVAIDNEVEFTSVLSSSAAVLRRIRIRLMGYQ